jgi:hypothetical protein
MPSKSHDAYADALIYAADQRVFKENREPRLCFGDLLHALQLLPNSPNPSHQACNGSRNHRSCLDDRGNA